jgi:hypothetical protein
MTKPSIKVDTKAVSVSLSRLMKQLPFAASQALNQVAKKAASDANAAMPGTFVHANAFTRQAVGTPSLATKSRLAAAVAIKPLQAKYLRLEIEGGTRTPSDNTRSTSARALTLPGSGPDPLRYGAIKSLITQAEADKAKRTAARDARRIMTVPTKAQAQRERRRQATSQLVTVPTLAQARARQPSNTGVFKMSGRGPEGGVGGFFLRLPGHHLKRLVAFEAVAQYQPKWDFKKAIIASAMGNLPGAFERALAQALASAR